MRDLIIIVVVCVLGSFTVEHLEAFLDQKWREESTLMKASRQRFQTLADETAVPQLMLKSINLRKRKAEDESPKGVAPPPIKRSRMSQLH